VQIADESALRDCFPDCELGAEPPIGRLWGIPTVMDESLISNMSGNNGDGGSSSSGGGDVITFQAGTHDQAVSMSLAEYRRIAQPEMAHFARPM